jgi:hypothetical protein
VCKKVCKRGYRRCASEEENERAKYNDFTAPRFFGRMHDFGCRK